MEILFVLVLGVLAVGAYVFFKSGKKDADATNTAVSKPEQAPLVTEQTVVLAAPPYPALESKDVKEELAKVISQVAETKQEQEPVVAETPVVTEEKAEPKVAPKAKRGPVPKSTATKAKRKK